MEEDGVLLNMEAQIASLTNENNKLAEELKQYKTNATAYKEVLKTVIRMMEDKLAGYNGVFKMAVENTKNEIQKYLDKKGVSDGNRSD